MKINWGTGIIIAFGLFMSFILYFVIKATTNEKYDHSLVADDYYEQELAYQNDINQIQNTKKLGIKLDFKRTENGITVQFPENFKIDNNTQIKVSLYRPSNQKLDSDFLTNLSNTATALIPKNKLVDGKWDIKLYWKQNNKSFLYKKDFVY